MSVERVESVESIGAEAGAAASVAAGAVVFVGAAVAIAGFGCDSNDRAGCARISGTTFVATSAVATSSCACRTPCFDSTDRETDFASRAPDVRRASVFFWKSAGLVFRLFIVS
ncbi:MULTISPECIES: hypothetical protein [Burkholderia]|uniref:hypothetical protein n=1 Tax=Burkholderia TaxID=32008 RepID=UPI000B0ABFDA|nr:MULTISPECIES: hypothetical protein [Burkholderia]